MAKRRTTRPKGPKKILEQEDHATSPPLDLESYPASDISPTEKPRPKPRPKPAKNSNTPSLPVPDATDHPQHATKRGRSKSDADETEPTSTDQPPAKKKKGSNGTSPIKHASSVGNSHLKVMPVPPRSPLPSRTNRVVNPGAPDKKRMKRTSTEMTVAAQQKEKLKLELARMEKEKIRMLAEMEEVEEQEQREEEGMRIKDIADLAESNAGGETDTQYDKEGNLKASDIDIVMADGNNNEDGMYVEPELDRPDTPVVEIVSELV